MSIFSITLFLHIVGALGVSVALGLEWLGLAQIRKTTVPDENRAILRVVKSMTRIGFVLMLLTVITGIYMVLAGVGLVPWILFVIGALILAMMIARALTAPRMAAIGRALATEKGAVSQGFHNLLNDPILSVSVQTRVAIVLGIIFLKIATPGFDGALLTMGAAIVLGLVSALPTLRRVQVHKPSTD